MSTQLLVFVDPDQLLREVFDKGGPKALDGVASSSYSRSMLSINISREAWIQSAEILKKFDLVNVKSAITPMETNVALTKDEEAVDVDVYLYRSMI
ncbi:hypothetical protein Tco_0770389, partial [Tanacetum coccineum]